MLTGAFAISLTAFQQSTKSLAGMHNQVLLFKDSGTLSVLQCRTLALLVWHLRCMCVLMTPPRLRYSAYLHFVPSGHVPGVLQVILQVSVPKLAMCDICILLFRLGLRHQLQLHIQTHVRVELIC